MPQITLKETKTTTRKIEIPMDALYALVDSLTDEERQKLLERLKTKPIELVAFKKDKLEMVLADFAATDLYEDGFLKDLQEGLEKSSMYK